MEAFKQGDTFCVGATKVGATKVGATKVTNIWNRRILALLAMVLY